MAFASACEEYKKKKGHEIKDLKVKVIEKERKKKNNKDSHQQTDCFIVPQLFNEAKPTRHFRPRWKPNGCKISRLSYSKDIVISA